MAEGRTSERSCVLVCREEEGEDSSGARRKTLALSDGLRRAFWRR